MKELVFFGSSIAGLLQRNQYVKLSEPFEAFFKNHHPVEYIHVFHRTRSHRDKVSELQADPFFQRIEQMSKNTQQVQEVKQVQKMIQDTTKQEIQRASKEYKDTLQEHKSLEEKVSKGLPIPVPPEKTAFEVIRAELKKPDLPEDTRKALENQQQLLQVSRARVAKVYSALESAELTKEETRKHANTQFGIRFEKSALDIFAEKMQVTVETPTNIFRRKIFEFENHSVVLAGKIDGWIPSTRTVLEVKNRMNRFFPNLVEYEKVQLNTYLYITGAENSYLIQTLKGKETKVDIKEYHMDEEWFREFELDLKAFVAKYLELVQSPEMLEEYADCMTGHEKEQFLKKLFSW